MKIKIVRCASFGFTMITPIGRMIVPTCMAMEQNINPFPGDEVIAENLDFDSPELARYTYWFDGSEVPIEGLKEALVKGHGRLFASEE